MANGKLEWMYQNSNKVDPEDYLLGRAIDKNFEKRNSNDGEDKDVFPSSIFASSNSGLQVDVFRKMKEDPLEQIKQKEIEMRKQILKNPVKLKKLQKMLKEKEEKEIRKEKKKKNRDKDIDDILTEKYVKLINKYGAKHLIELTKSEGESDEGSNKSSERCKQIKKGDSRSASESNSDSSSCSDRSPKYRLSDKTGNRFSRRERKNRHAKDLKKMDDANNESDRGEHRKSSASVHSKKHKRIYGPERPSKREGAESSNKRDTTHKLRSLSTDEESDCERNATYSKSGHDSLVRKTQRNVDYSSDKGKFASKRNYGLVLPKGIEQKLPSTSHNEQPYIKKKTEPEAKKRFERPKPSKLSESEKQAKLKEMMKNAERREKERKDNVTKYKEDQKKEDAKEKTRTYSEDFMRRELAKATSNSIEGRIKSNINHLQRSKFSMDQHFAKRV